MKPVTIEATVVYKDVEMTHGNSFHYVTFEFDSGERVYFQVSIKCYMMILEGDRCLITYKDHRNSSKKKLKSFEVIAKKIPFPKKKPVLATTVEQKMAELEKLEIFELEKTELNESKVSTEKSESVQSKENKKSEPKSSISTTEKSRQQGAK